jgi:hypothetical protein
MGVDSAVHMQHVVLWYVVLCCQYMIAGFGIEIERLLCKRGCVLTSRVGLWEGALGVRDTVLDGDSLYGGSCSKQACSGGDDLSMLDTATFPTHTCARDKGYSFGQWQEACALW